MTKQEYQRNWREKNKEHVREYNRVWREDHREYSKEYHKAHHKNDPKRSKNRCSQRVAVKIEVLTHYGPDSTLGCCWEGCVIQDVDMLTLDHINDNGAQHIITGQSKRLSGSYLYSWVKNNKYPEGFQTLCANHQLKKWILKLRSCK